MCPLSLREVRSLWGTEAPEAFEEPVVYRASPIRPVHVYPEAVQTFGIRLTVQN